MKGTGKDLSLPAFFFTAIHTHTSTCICDECMCMYVYVCVAGFVRNTLGRSESSEQ